MRTIKNVDDKVIHMQMKFYTLLCILPLLGLLASCKVDFNPNGTWQEIPAVYCLLDQDDDTTFVRVQKCYLGEGNSYDYAKILDSINYPEGRIGVYLQEWNATGWQDSNANLVAVGSAPVRTFQFAYAEVQKDSGLFNSERQPLYYYVTKGLLDSTRLYRLVVVDNANGDTLATATTSLLRGKIKLKKPNSNVIFNFNNNGVCESIWSAMGGARRYQPSIRFFYNDFKIDSSQGDFDTIYTPKHVDILFDWQKSSMDSRTITYYFSQSRFLTTIKHALANDAHDKRLVDSVDISIRCCDEKMVQYLHSHELNNGINQSDYSYTNIDGGIGIFASRRTHLTFTVPAPVYMSNYVRNLDSLNVGFNGHFGR
ncbi:MAG: hypothetical protein SPJ13_05480 [Bacteroidales bacterium]|nr:hypothetical protein [Bacteroidales bacterium]